MIFVYIKISPIEIYVPIKVLFLGKIILRRTISRMILYIDISIIIYITLKPRPNKVLSLLPPSIIFFSDSWSATKPGTLNLDLRDGDAVVNFSE